MIFAHAGNTEQATGILNTTESFARKKIDAGGLGVALRHIAKAFAETEQLAQALNILSDVSDDSNRTPVLIAAATKQAQAGDAAAALAAANAVAAARKIDDNRLRAHTLWTIAAEQIRAGDDPGPQKTKTYANQATGDIKSTLSRVWMFSEIAAWAAFDHGLTVARSIDNSWGRARAFGRLAATLIKLVDPGDTAGAKSR